MDKHSRRIEMSYHGVAGDETVDKFMGQINKFLTENYYAQLLAREDKQEIGKSQQSARVYFIPGASEERTVNVGIQMQYDVNYERGKVKAQISLKGARDFLGLGPTLAERIKFDCKDCLGFVIDQDELR